MPVRRVPTAFGNWLSGTSSVCSTGAFEPKLKRPVCGLVLDTRYGAEVAGATSACAGASG